MRPRCLVRKAKCAAFPACAAVCVYVRVYTFFCSCVYHAMWQGWRQYGKKIRARTQTHTHEKCQNARQMTAQKCRTRRLLLLLRPLAASRWPTHVIHRDLRAGPVCKKVNLSEVVANVRESCAGSLCVSIFIPPGC